MLTGDMSLVGPRPEAPRYVELYDAQQRTLLSDLRIIVRTLAAVFRR